MTDRQQDALFVACIILLFAVTGLAATLIGLIFRVFAKVLIG